MTTISAERAMTAPFFLLDLAYLLPNITVFVLNDSLLGGPDVLGMADVSETLSKIIGVNDIAVVPMAPLAIVEKVGLALSPTTNLVQAISGIAYCNSPGATAQFDILTTSGNTVLLTAIWNGRRNVNVNYGAAA